MCLAAPAQVIAVEGEEALVELNGVRLTVSRLLTPDLAPGDVALVHVGFVLSRIDPEEAEATLQALSRAGLEAAP